MSEIATFISLPDHSGTLPPPQEIAIASSSCPQQKLWHSPCFDILSQPSPNHQPMLLPPPSKPIPNLPLLLPSGSGHHYLCMNFFPVYSQLVFLLPLLATLPSLFSVSLSAAGGILAGPKSVYVPPPLKFLQRLPFACEGYTGVLTMSSHSFLQPLLLWPHAHHCPLALIWLLPTTFSILRHILYWYI